MNADRHRSRRPVLSVFMCVSLWPASLATAAQWKIQYFYDRADSNFTIEDLQCPTSQHCVAAGLIDDKRGHEQGAVVVTSDGGLHWSQYEVKETPLSLFFLNEGQGWMVTDRGLWSTVEGGRSWVKKQSRRGILETWFLDANHGYIAGLKGMAEETSDGGSTWSKLEASEKVTGAESLSYDIITFRGMHGLIVGAGEGASATGSLHLRPQPEKEDESRKITVLETLDGGKKWTAGSVPLDGELSQLRLSERGFVVSLIVYRGAKYPIGSAVYETPLGSPDGRLIFAERDRAATDIALLKNGSAVLVTVEPPGSATQVLIPGKLKILKSANLKVWEEMPVDYRAVAQRAIIAAPDSQNIWVATDTGAILKLAD
jgi:hypothetical protein